MHMSTKSLFSLKETFLFVTYSQTNLINILAKAHVIFFVVVFVIKIDSHLLIQ